MAYNVSIYEKKDYESKVFLKAVKTLKSGSNA